jgi:hypothetical protein
MASPLLLERLAVWAAALTITASLRRPCTNPDLFLGLIIVHTVLFRASEL